MIGFIKMVVIETLRATGNPNLIAVADWITDAERAAVKLIAKTISQSIRANGRITSDAERTILNAKNRSDQITSTDKPSSKPTFLSEYLDLLEYIASVGSRRKWLLLQGFVHSSECSSLWTFEKDEDAVLEIGKSVTELEPCIQIPDANLKIHLFEKMTDKDIKCLNRELGKNRRALPSQIQSQEVPKVLSVFEDSVRLYVPKKRKAKRFKRDSNGVRKPIEVDELYWEVEDEEIDKDAHAGVQNMVHSLPIAIAAREEILAHLQDIMGTQPDK